MTALCKSKACPVLCFRAEKTVKRALSTLYAKNVTEQQESAPEAPVNANIAVMQFQAEILVDKINMKKLYPNAIKNQRHFRCHKSYLTDFEIFQNVHISY